MGKRCELYTDDKSLKYIFTQANLNLRQRRWLDEFAKLKIMIWESTITLGRPMW
jgi:hypothetical protein